MKQKDLIDERVAAINKLQKLNAPLVILGHSALCLATRCLTPESGSFKALARWIVEHERGVTRCFNPESEEAKDLAQIEKDLDDDDFDRKAFLTSERSCTVRGDGKED